MQRNRMIEEVWRMENSYWTKINRSGI